MACCHRMHLNSSSISSKRIPFPSPNIKKKNGVTATSFEGNSHIQLLRIYMSITCSCSSEGESRRTSRKIKASNSLRNNVNLRQQLQDFIFAAGLPSSAVPSFKELSLHGREEESESFHRIISHSLQLSGDRISETQSVGSKKTSMELQHFNSVLQLKELELAKLKQELEEEKAKLYSLQAKAIAEVTHAKQILSDKESELNAADKALSGLKQVRIEYWVEGTNVEVTGSFNGWQHHISLEPDLTSEIRNSKGARGPSIWSTELWLYPGIYEIKFIVDGIWQVDFRRQIVTRDMFQNNILKVEN